MGIFEMILLAAGAVVFIVSFCIPVKEEKLKEETKNLAAQEVKSLVAEELENVKGRLEELSEEEMIEELARLLGGAQITDAVRQNAREIKELVHGIKTKK